MIILKFKVANYNKIALIFKGNLLQSAFKIFHIFKDANMEFKLAKSELNSKAKSISLDEIIKVAEQNGSATFYLDSENNAKDIQKLRATLEKANKSVQLNELKYGLDSYLYEIHIINY